MTTALPGPALRGRRRPGEHGAGRGAARRGGRGPDPCGAADLRLVGPDAEPGLFPEGGRRRGGPPLARGPDRAPADRRRGDLAPSRGHLRGGRPRRPRPGPARRRPLSRHARRHRRRPRHAGDRGRPAGCVVGDLPRGIVRFYALPIAMPRISCPGASSSSAARSDGVRVPCSSTVRCSWRARTSIPELPGVGDLAPVPDGPAILVEPAARRASPRPSDSIARPADVSGTARRRAEVLRREVYGDPSWTRRR